MRINERDFWIDGIHLRESGKILIAKNFINYVNNCLSKTQSQGPGVQQPD